MAETKDRTRKPSWYPGPNPRGRIVIQVGGEAQAALNAAAYERAAHAYLRHDRARRVPPRAECQFCGGAIERSMGVAQCIECSRPPGTPLSRTEVATILATLLRCDRLVVDSMQRDEDDYYAVMFTDGEPSEDTSGAVETAEQWALWTALSKGGGTRG